MSNQEQEFLVQKIRTQYTEKQHTELDALKSLDNKVKGPADGFAYTYGSIGAIVMGAGMSLVMTDIGAVIGLAGTAALAAGISVGIVGMALALTTYPIYKGILSARRKKYAPQILTLSDRILNNETPAE